MMAEPVIDDNANDPIPSQLDPRRSPPACDQRALYSSRYSVKYNAARL
jgi:hypothetical protein